METSHFPTFTFLGIIFKVTGVRNTDPAYPIVKVRKIDSNSEEDEMLVFHQMLHRQA